MKSLDQVNHPAGAGASHRALKLQNKSKFLGSILNELMEFASSVPDFRRSGKGNIRHRLDDSIMLLMLGRAYGCVGCYKPVCHSAKTSRDRSVDYGGFVTRLKAILDEHSSNLTSGFALFGFECRESILDMEKSGEHTIPKLVEEAYKAGSTYDTTIRAGMQIKEETALPESSRISY